MTLRERTMSSGFVRTERVYGYEGKWYYVGNDRKIAGPFSTSAQAQQSLDCGRLLDSSAIDRINSLQLSPI